MNVHVSAAAFSDDDALVEQLILGRSLIDNSACDEMLKRSKQDWFCEGFHQRLYAAIEKLRSEGERVTIQTVKLKAANDPAWRELGGLG